MRDMLAETPAQIGVGFGETLGLITDGRFSGSTWGMVAGHVAPEAFVGGLIGLVHGGGFRHHRRDPAADSVECG